MSSFADYPKEEKHARTILRKTCRASSEILGLCILFQIDTSVHSELVIWSALDGSGHLALAPDPATMKESLQFVHTQLRSPSTPIVI